METNFQEVGKICPLCKRGIFSYFKLGASSLFGKQDYEFTSCTNNECQAHIEISRSSSVSPS